jgi:TRAP-type C4-dicarboxylate transport system permease small subunit
MNHAVLQPPMPGVSMSLQADTAAPAPARAGWPGRLIEIVLRLTMAGILLVVLGQIVGRLTGHPLSWTEELTRALFIWMIFIGMAASMRKVEAARVTVALQWLSPSLRRIALPIYVVACLGFFGLMVWTGVGMVRQQMRMGETIATLGWPSWVIGLVIPVAAMLAIVCTLASLKDGRRAILAEEDGTP